MSGLVASGGVTVAGANADTATDGVLGLGGTGGEERPRDLKASRT